MSYRSPWVSYIILGVTCTWLPSLKHHRCKYLYTGVHIIPISQIYRRAHEYLMKNRKFSNIHGFGVCDFKFTTNMVKFSSTRIKRWSPSRNKNAKNKNEFSFKNQKNPIFSYLYTDIFIAQGEKKILAGNKFQVLLNFVVRRCHR